MAIRIQLRRDTSANWASANPVLRAGEIGIETDTLKFKVGNGSSAWNSITAYANVVPTDLNTTLNGYLEVTDIGDTVAGLDGNNNLLIPNDSIIFEGATANAFELTLVATDPTADRTITLPDVNGTVVTTGDTGSVTNTMLAGSIANNKLVNSSITINGFPISLGGEATYSSDNIQEGTTNKYFSAELAQDAVAQALANGTHTNITVSYNDNSNAISLTGAVTYTDENAQDAVGNAVGNGLDYDDNTGAISVDPSEFALSAVGAPTGNVAMATYKITGLGTPTDSTDAATKAYVDAVTEGLHIHPSVVAATTANVTLASALENGDTLDGVTLATNDRILVKNQTTTSENGIYVVQASGQPIRATDFDTASEVDSGDFVFVSSGTANGSTGWVQTNKPATIGTDPILFTQFTGAGTYTAGTGLTLTGTAFSINTGTTVDLNTAQTLTNKTITGTFTGNVTGDVTGNAGTVTNGVYTNGSYSDPSWITSLAKSKVGLGNVENTALSTWAGSTSITTLGTVTTGTWSATAIGSTKGGTGQTSYASGDILYASATDTLAKLAKGTDGQILTLASGVPSWAAAPITLPSQSGNSGKFLTTNGTDASWADTPIITGTATISANTATTIDTNALNAFTSAEYMVSLKQGSKVRTSKVIVQTDGTSVDMTEFAITETGGIMSGVVVSASASGGNALLQVTVTDASSTNVAVKFSEVRF